MTGLYLQYRRLPEEVADNHREDIRPGTAGKAAGNRIARKAAAADIPEVDFEHMAVVGPVRPRVPGLIKIGRRTGRTGFRRHWQHGNEGSTLREYYRNGRTPMCHGDFERRIWDMVLLPDTYVKYDLNRKRQAILKV
jgi:hypothetical protein